MHRWIGVFAAMVLALGALDADAQQKKPAPAAAPAKPAPAATAKPAGDRSTPLYFYLTDAAGNRVLVQTQFSLTNLDNDTKVLRRLHGVLAGLNDKGFRRNDEISISDWSKKEKFAKCFIYLEDEEAGRGKGTGARVWCAESGISEVGVQPSDDPKHVDKVIERFAFFLAKARENIK